ncbi:MAG TPA: hypothetical protein VJ729_09495 [Nitrososphaeraceae archaeon]|jgi:hypothetical protein|nr:hypothetical protein [Nitrososphaeraceae archaeon]
MQNGCSNVLVTHRITSQSGRTFYAKYLSFQNGCFIALDEGSDALGSVSVSISSSNRVSSAKIIPSKHDSMFVNTISQRISSMINGICLASFHSTKQLQFDDMKAIMDEIMKLINSEDIRNDDKKLGKKKAG